MHALCEKHILKSKCTKHNRFGPLLEVEMSKKCTPLCAKHISKSKCTKHLSVGPLLEVQMSKKCTPLWRETHFEVKMYKTHHSVKTRERRGSSFSQLGLEPNHTGLTAQSLFFLEESCRVKRSDTQTFSNFSNYFKRVLKLQKRSSSFSK